MRIETNQNRRAEHGNVLVFVTIALVALFGFAAWSTETGQAWMARGQLQAASDSAALAGAGELIDPNANQPSDPAAAIAAAQAFGLENKSIGVAIDIPAGDIETGRWNTTTRTFTPLPGSTDRTEVRAVRLLGRRDDVANGPIPTVLGRIMGVDSIAVNTQAVGYIGFAGLMPPGSALLPVAIDCCAISGSACDSDYCAVIAANKPNPCQVPGGDFVGQTVSCLEFFSTPAQNACWTELSPTSTSVSASGLQDIVQNANPTPVGGQPVYLDNGTKTPVLQEIQERFMGQGAYSGDPAGEDTNGNGTIDSWLVPFPIVECQNPGAHCSGGAPQKIVGVVCFDLKWASVGPDKRIYGNFVCPSDPRFESSACGVGFGPGGDVPTIDAQYPVLVD
jgi:Putative Flp pilus-assembly TadE/G-like